MTRAMRRIPGCTFWPRGISRTGWPGNRSAWASPPIRPGNLLLLGLKPDESLAVFERTFNRCMGLCTASDSQSLWLSSRFQLWRLENMLADTRDTVEFDRLYVPRVCYTTGDIDVHDLAVATDGRVIFVNTLFSCLATISERYNFDVVWRPPFITRLAAEDRCHLNGLALPRRATTVRDALRTAPT